MIIPPELLALATKKELGRAEAEKLIRGVQEQLAPIVGFSPWEDDLHFRIEYRWKNRVPTESRGMHLGFQVIYLGELQAHGQRRFMVTYEIEQSRYGEATSRKGHKASNSLQEILDYFLEKHENLTAEWTLGSLA